MGEESKKIELNNLEYMVVYELEQWKKAEEKKTLALLKQKEMEYWSNITEQQKKSDIEKNKLFKAKEEKIRLLEKKVLNLLQSLQKREGTI